MISVLVTCPTCRGAGIIHPPPVDVSWLRCSLCDGIGRSWAPGAPLYDCVIILADRDPGEIVTLGNGERAKIAWHMPRRKKKVRPLTTFLLLLDEFTERENPNPVPYPSCVGVASVDVSRRIADHDDHAGERAEDLNDPVQRTIAGGLM